MYAKLFASILDSSIWLEPAPTRIVWLTLLAAKDVEGFARFATARNLADRARVTIEEATTAIGRLEGPDPESSNPAHEGRRIERVPGGWVILNAKLYDDMVRKEDERRQVRERVRRHREKHAGQNGDTPAPAPELPDEDAAGVLVFLARYDFGHWRQIVEGFIRSSALPIAVISEFEMHLQGEMGYKKTAPIILGFALNQYINADGFTGRLKGALFAGFIRGALRAVDRNKGRASNDHEAARIAEEQLLAERRKEEEREGELVARYRARDGGEEALATLHREAEELVPRQFKGDTRAVLVHTQVVMMVKKHLKAR